MVSTDLGTYNISQYLQLEFVALYTLAYNYWNLQRKPVQNKCPFIPIDFEEILWRFTNDYKIVHFEGIRRDIEENLAERFRKKLPK